MQESRDGSLRPLYDVDQLKGMLEAEPRKTVRIRNILYRLRQSTTVLVDNPEKPGAVLLTQDQSLWELYAPELDVGRSMLDRFRPDGTDVILVGLPLPLVAHLRERGRVAWETPVFLYILPESSDFRPAELRDPGLGKLSSEHAKLVAGAWPHGPNGEGKEKYLRACIEQGPTAAIYRDGHPVSFGLTHSDGSMGAVHTEPAFRGQGLAKQVVSAIGNELLTRGAPLFAYVIIYNETSRKLVEGLGLQVVHHVSWMGLA